MAKKRLDVLLLERGFTQSRERAKTTIMEGIVYVNGQKADKVGEQFFEDVEIEVRSNESEFVSRGGKKIAMALRHFDIKTKGLICMDIGASSGGFTDCLLKNGAAKVYAIDVGYGQLDWKLREDERVKCMERTNIRYVTPEMLEQTPEFAVIDVSFISLKLVLPVVYNLLTQDGKIACLIKPQFEAGKGKVGKNGVVRDYMTHIEVLENFIEYVKKSGFYLYGITFSPIKGPKGNIEFLGYIGKNLEGNIEECSVKKIVEEAHFKLNKKE